MQIVTFPLTPLHLFRSAPGQRSLCAVHRPKHAGRVSVAFSLLLPLIATDTEVEGNLNSRLSVS